MKKKKLFLLDVYPILYRSHFAMQSQHLYTRSGLNTSAILGFCNYIFQIIFKEKPQYIAAAFDSYSAERKALQENYKGNRDKMPEDIAVAKKYVTELIEALNITVLKETGYEADDVIGSIAQKAARKGDIEVFIVSPDKDFAQLVDENIFLYRPSYQGVNFDILDAEKVKSKFGLPPEQIADYLALKGDPVDNISGVPKIGEKTAVELLTKYRSVEEVLEKREEISKPSIRKTLLENEEAARVSKALALINTSLPLEFQKDKFKLQGPKTDLLVQLLDELEFVRLKERIFSNAFYKKYFKQQPPLEEEPQVCNYHSISNDKELEELLDKVSVQKELYFLTTTEDDYLNMVFLLEGNAYHYFTKTRNIPEKILDILVSEDVLKVTYQSKPLSKLLQKYGKQLNQSFYDVLLKHYLISPDANHQLDKIIAQELGASVNGGSSLSHRMCAEVFHLKTIKENWDANPVIDELDKLYREIDLPLVNVIARMEENGIKPDIEGLGDISQLFQDETYHIEQRIFDIAGEEFNLRSSKQTAEYFSRIMKDTPVKKTKTGQISTSEASLKEYAREYEIAEQLLRYRKLTKLVSTYTESLPTYIDAETERIHADFLQAHTATGRLSCRNPNLQNLPVLSEEGREVRRAIIPENEDYLILAADYSQIELRLLAGLSKDEGLTKAFSEHEDVHTITAAKVFNVPESEVTKEMRSKAKMVNYGIAYGISAFGLSQNLKIPMSEGKEIIEQYFLKFPGIKQFIERTIRYAKDKGYSETMTGRRRYIEDINSRNGTERRAAERVAINAPIQGLAADLIKISMIEIDQEFQKRNFRSKMIMQVHDELVFEVFKPELNEVAPIVKEKMEKAIDIGVPLEVDMGVGANWLDLEDFS